MDYLKEIENTSTLISFESDLMIKKSDDWINFIEPIFNKKFPEWEYRYEYENLYSIPEIRKFLKFQRKRFNNKFHYCFFLINNDDEILDKNLEWNSDILGIESDYALFTELKEVKDYEYQKIKIITFLR
jgi:disulfide oxidoreductase YuzD